MSDPKRLPEEEWNTALHEAGHAVASLAFGYWIESVTIEPIVERGHTIQAAIYLRDFLSLEDLRSGCPVRRHVYSLYKFAGATAETLFSPHPDPQAWKGAAAGDIGECRWFLEIHARGKVEERIAELKEETARFLAPLRPSVEAIAVALLRDRKLDHAACRQAVSAACRVTPSALPIGWNVGPARSPVLHRED